MVVVNTFLYDSWSIGKRDSATHSCSARFPKAAGDFTDHSWVKDCFGQDMPIFNCRKFDAVWEDGALFKHGNLYQGIYADPMRDVVGIYYSTCPVTGDSDLLPGYIRQAAKNLAGK